MCTELTQPTSFSGSLFFAHLGGIRGVKCTVITLPLTENTKILYALFIKYLFLQHNCYSNLDVHKSLLI